MQLSDIPFGTVRVRMVEYSPGYLADHWCHKGHILLCLSGELHTELADGRRYVLTPGTSYQVADHAAAPLVHPGGRYAVYCRLGAAHGSPYYKQRRRRL